MNLLEQPHFNTDIQLIATSLSILEKKHRFLLNRKVAEPCINHQLAILLTEVYPEHDIDCEYNINTQKEGFKKHILLEDRELQDIYKKYNTWTKKKKDAFKDKRIIPDIIIHERGSGSKNKMIIETKRRHNSESEAKAFDQLKLIKYTCAVSEFQYEFGVYIEFDDGQTRENIGFRDHRLEAFHLGESCFSGKIIISTNNPDEFQITQTNTHTNSLR